MSTGSGRRRRLAATVTMTAAGRRREEGIKSSSATAKRSRISKGRSALRGCGNRGFTRFISLQEMLFFRARKINRERKRKRQQVACATTLFIPDTGTTRFWRDPDAMFCSICGEDKEKHLELMCPYNYLSPAAYSPCKAKLALWGNYTTTLRYSCSRHRGQGEPPVHDEANSRRLNFMRCFVRVNNLPQQCYPEELAALFRQFGPLRMWHIVKRRSGAWGFGGMVFQNRDHAGEAIEALNCRRLGDSKLRVDWAYPCLNS